MTEIRPHLTLVLFLGLAFAGCVGTGDAESTTTPAPTTTGTSAGGPNATTESPEPMPPQVDVAVSVNGTFADRVNGSYEVPRGQNVTFDASASFDPDGSELNFTWDFGDNETGSGVVVAHAWMTAADFEVTLEVIDEQGQNASVLLPVSVVLRRLPNGTFIRNETKLFTGTVTAGTQGTAQCGVLNSVDTVRKDWIINATDNETGTPLIVTNFTMTIKSQGATGLDVDYYFYDPGGKEVGRSAHFEPLDGREEGFSEEGEFAPGKYQLVVRGCLGANMSFSVEMFATFVAGP